MRTLASQNKRMITAAACRIAAGPEISGEAVALGMKWCFTRNLLVVATSGRTRKVDPLAAPCPATIRGASLATMRLFWD